MCYRKLNSKSTPIDTLFAPYVHANIWYCPKGTNWVILMKEYLTSYFTYSQLFKN